MVPLWSPPQGPNTASQTNKPVSARSLSLRIRTTHSTPSVSRSIPFTQHPSLWANCPRASQRNCGVFQRGESLQWNQQVVVPNLDKLGGIGGEICVSQCQSNHFSLVWHLWLVCLGIVPALVRYRYRDLVWRGIPLRNSGQMWGKNKSNDYR